MKIHYSIQEVQRLFHIEKLRNAQISPINAILNKKDTLVIAPTASGKSAIYQLPAVVKRDMPTLVIEPTLSLIHDQVHKLQSLGILVAYLDSTLGCGEKQSIFMRLYKNSLNFLYLTPEQFISHDFRKILKSVPIYMVVIDEAHCVLDWGYSFRSAYLKLGEVIDSLEHHPIITAFTATANQSDCVQIASLLHMDPQIFISSLHRKNLIFLKHHTSSRTEKKVLLLKYLKKYHTGASVVYCNTKKSVNAVYEALSKDYPNQVVKCHSGMNPATRAKHELAFLSGDKLIMVSTSAFGMGVDKGNIDLVIHFNMPCSMNDYIQQAGRAGRDGQRAHCVLLSSDDDFFVNQTIISNSDFGGPSERIRKSLDQMKEYCDDKKHCQSNLLLWYLGEEHKKRCKFCTNCQKKRREIK